MKVTIAGSAAVITSDLSLENIKTVAKYKPSALTLYGGEDGKTPLFGICAGKQSAGSINEAGAEFGTQTADDGKATITVVFKEPVDDAKAYVADVYGGALLNLAKLEAKLPEVIDQINAEKAEVLSNITVA